MKHTCIFLFAFILNICLSTQVYANVVWPSLILAQRTIALAPISAGILVEYIFLIKFAKLGTWRTLFAVLLMNLLSALIGIYPIAFSGLFWEQFIGKYINEALNIGTFNPFAWIATLIIAVLINTLIEGLTLSWGFKLKIWKKGFIWLGCANTVSLFIACLSIYLKPPF